MIYRDTENTGHFPETQISAVLAIKSERAEERQRGMGRIIEAYWKPAYKYIRIRFRQPVEDARDLTQGFFARALEKDYLAGYDAGKAKFRTFLRICIDRFVSNEFSKAGRQKRGGNEEILSLDFEGAEEELQRLSSNDVPDIERFFEAEWVRAVLENSVMRLESALREQGKEVHFSLFRAYDLTGEEERKDLTYEKLGEVFGLKVSDVTNYLSSARKEFRAIVIDTVRDLTCSEAEFREELNRILGIKL